MSKMRCFTLTGLKNSWLADILGDGLDKEILCIRALI